MSGDVVVKRDELFRLIWAEPVTRVSARFGISDVALAKICRKMDIPRPERGYWARRQYGHTVAIPNLKKPTEKTVTEVRIEGKKESMRQCYVPSTESLSIQEMHPPIKIVLRSQLVESHPLVRSTQEVLQKCRIDDYGRLMTKGLNCLYIRVSKKNVNRALLIMDAIIKALEERNFPVYLRPPGYEGYYRTCATILAEEIEFGLFEYAKKVDHIMTDKEIKDQKRYPNIYLPRPYDYLPSGKISILIDPHSYCAYKITLHDSNQDKVEKSLKSFIISLMKTAEANKAKRLEREREEREIEAARILRKEHERQRQEIEHKKQELQREVAAWEKSQRLREYIETVRKQAMEKYGAIHPGTTLHDWLTWATNQLDLDPAEKRVQQGETQTYPVAPEIS